MCHFLTLFVCADYIALLLHLQIEGWYFQASPGSYREKNEFHSQTKSGSPYLVSLAILAASPSGILDCG